MIDKLHVIKQMLTSCLSISDFHSASSVQWVTMTDNHRRHDRHFQESQSLSILIPMLYIHLMIGINSISPSISAYTLTDI